MSTPAPVSLARRWAAVGTLFLEFAALVVLALFTVSRWELLVIGLICLSALSVGGWEALSRRGVGRVLGVVVAVAGLLGFSAALIATESLWLLALVLLLAMASLALAGYALRSPAAGPHLWAAPPAPKGRHPVLIMNLRSGGGKAERFELERRCRERGIESIVLRPGSDLLELAEDAVARGADVIGMAGGDGSQALVASVASKHGIPHVVIPAGTRNHFALDLGLDREDVVGALDAYEDGHDTVIDLAEVNGRIFVNNASMGVYARVVQSEAYRDAKMQTAAAILPDILGPDATPLDLQHALPSGGVAPTAALILVANNRYDLRHLRGGGSRPRIDAGELGVVSLRVASANEAQRFAALEVTGQIRRFRGWQEWAAPTFEVRSSSPVEIGIDGEALTLDPPLRFSIRPKALTVRLPASAGLSPAAAALRPTERSSLVQLAALARGHDNGPKGE